MLHIRVLQHLAVRSEHLDLNTVQRLSDRRHLDRIRCHMVDIRKQGSACFGASPGIIELRIRQKLREILPLPHTQTARADLDIAKPSDDPGELILHLGARQFERGGDDHHAGAAKLDDILLHVPRKRKAVLQHDRTALPEGRSHLAKGQRVVERERDQHSVLGEDPDSIPGIDRDMIDGSVAEHNALGSPRRTRGEDHLRDVLRIRLHILRYVIRRLCEGRALCIELLKGVHPALLFISLHGTVSKIQRS